MSNKEILQKAMELVELLEKQEESGKVALSMLKRGEVFQTTGKRKYKVLEQYGDTAKIISLDLVKENVEFGYGTDYNKSNVKKLCDTEILKDFEEEFCAENIEEHMTDIITVDGQKVGSEVMSFVHASNFNRKYQGKLLRFAVKYRRDCSS